MNQARRARALAPVLVATALVTSASALSARR